MAMEMTDRAPGGRAYSAKARWVQSSQLLAGQEGLTSRDGTGKLAQEDAATLCNHSNEVWCSGLRLHPKVVIPCPMSHLGKASEPTD